MTGNPPTIRCLSTVLEDIRRHVVTDLGVEHGGLLVGRSHPGTVDVIGAIPALAATSDATSLTFTPDAWADMEQTRLERFPDETIVGWYHSHPGFGIFLSNHDRYIHENFFAQPHHVAYVIDPVSNCDGFFAWAESRLTRSSNWALVNSDRTITTLRVDAVPSIETPVREPPRAQYENETPAPSPPPAQEWASPFRLTSWALPIGAAFALGLGFVLGSLIGGDSDRSVTTPGLGAEAAAIAEASTASLRELIDDGTEESWRALPAAIASATTAFDFAESTIATEPSANDAAIARQAAAELEDAIIEAQLAVANGPTQRETEG